MSNIFLLLLHKFSNYFNVVGRPVVIFTSKNTMNRHDDSKENSPPKPISGEQVFIPERENYSKRCSVHIHLE